MLIAVAAIHLLPLIGVFGAGRLFALYGVSVTDPNLEILMRHRAVLFGLVGGFMLFAAFRVEWQVIAMIAGIVSVGSFFVLAWMIGNYNTHLSGVIRVDVLAAVLLVVGSVAIAFRSA